VRLLSNDYAVCAWAGRFLFQPNEYRINRMVQQDLTRAVKGCVGLPSEVRRHARGAIDSIEDVRRA
jgi:hypothetical protein